MLIISLCPEMAKKKRGLAAAAKSQNAKSQTERRGSKSQSEGSKTQSEERGSGGEELAPNLIKHEEPEPKKAVVRKNVETTTPTTNGTAWEMVGGADSLYEAFQQAPTHSMAVPSLTVFC